MPDPVLFLCNRARRPATGWEEAVTLSIGGEGIVRFDHEALLRRLGSPVTNRMIDLVEIAAFVYAGDARVRRGGITEPRQGAFWRRNFVFRIGVRDADFWGRQDVVDALVDLLGFLSDDDYTFEFEQVDRLAPHQGQFGLSSNAGVKAQDVVMFSGGLDSLSGAIDLLGHGRKLALVSVQTADRVGGTQRVLSSLLKDRFGASRQEHFQLGIKLKKDFAKERTHRTRAFLFAAIGTAVARAVDLDVLHFFENGVLSLNLPIASAVVGTRATRTTHPRTLKLFSKLFELCMDAPFRVINPWFELTKTDVVSRLEQRGCADLINDTRSCARTRVTNNAQPHCGRCSQCIDRRFAVLAAGLEAEDAAEAYEIDLLFGPRQSGPDLVLALSYHDAARRMAGLDAHALMTEFPETAQVLSHLDRPRKTAIEAVIKLHRRHGAQVIGVTRRATHENSERLATQSLDPDCLLVRIVGQGAQAPQARPSPRPTDNAAAMPVLIGAFKDNERPPLFRLKEIGDISGVGATTLLALRDDYQAGLQGGLLPEHFPFMPSPQLAERLGIEDEAGLRQRLHRVRIKFKKLMEAAGLPAPDVNDLVDTHPRKGYRINPTRVRIVSWAELTAD